MWKNNVKCHREMTFLKATTCLGIKNLKNNIFKGANESHYPSYTITYILPSFIPSPLLLFSIIKDTINPLQLFTFTNVIRCSRLPLWIVYFTYWKFTCVSSVATSSSIKKKKNSLINKEMCSFIWCFFSIEKKWRSQNLSEKYISRKENLKKCPNFEEQKGTRYIRESVYSGLIIFSCFSSTKCCLRFLLNCFVQEIKGFFYQSSLGNEVDFRDTMDVSPNILAKN